MTQPLQPFSRLRSRGALKQGALFVSSASGPAANYTTVTGYGAAVGSVESMSDVVTPGFSKIRAQGGTVFRPMNRSVVSHTPSSSSTSAIVQITPAHLAGQKYTDSGDWISMLMCGTTPSTSVVPGVILPKSILSPTVVDRTISEACTKAQRLPSDANLLVTMAELHKTMRLVPDLWTNWARFFQSFNTKVETLYGKRMLANPRRQSSQNLQALREVTQDTWLAMRFGARPLIMDTMGVMEAIKAGLDVGPVRLTSRGKSAVSGYEVSNHNHNYYTLATTITSAYTHEIRVRAMTLLEIEVDSFQRKLGLSIGSVPEAVVDLVSYSFVVNWMVTLNDFFSAVGRIAQPGMKSLGGCFVVSNEKSVVHQLTSCTITNPSFSLDSSPSGITSCTSNTRERVVGLRAPSITIRADPFKFLRDFRLLDAVALVSKQVKRPIRL